MNLGVNYLQKRWQGPAIDVQVGQLNLQLGQGIPTTKLIIHTPSLLPRLVLRPSLTFGQAYMKGEIVIEGQLIDVMQGFHQSRLIPPMLARVNRLFSLLPNTVGQAIRNAQHHYDIGNDFYRLWLDQTQTYSCAYFETGQENIDEAQQKKLSLICQKLRLEPNQTLLDIGCGWGALIFYAAANYGVKATGITPSKEQAAFIRQEVKKRRLEEKITVIESDWRSLSGTYDRLVSVGMFEHVGRAHYKQFLRQWQSLLKTNGISLLHTIGRRETGPSDPWIKREIFPGGFLPTIEQIQHPLELDTQLRVYRIENWRPHYALTLKLWSENFERVQSQVTTMLGESFVRKWRLYLQGSQAGFMFGALDLYQFEIYGPTAKLPLKRTLISS